MLMKKFPTISMPTAKWIKFVRELNEETKKENMSSEGEWK
jgi:hypothetical protein